MKNVQDNEIQGVKKPVQLKYYHSPELTSYGTISQLTKQHDRGSTSDAGMDTMGS